MKVVGKFRNSSIHLDKFYVQRSYGDFLGLNGNILHEANQFLFNSIPEDFERYNPRDLPIIIYKEGLKIKKLLPAIMVIGEFYCGEGCHEDYWESSLLVVWFQERDENFFTNAEKVISQIDWLSLAKDFGRKSDV